MTRPPCQKNTPVFLTGPSWTICETDGGYLLSLVDGQVADPFAVATTKARAIYLLELLEWAEVLGRSGVIPAPPKPPRRRRRQ